MKKIILTIAVIIALEGLALAGTGVPGGTFTFKQSNNVSIQYDTDNSGATGQKYYVNAKHSAGDRVYSTTNATSNIWYKTVAVSDTASAGMQTAGESQYSGWSSQ